MSDLELRQIALNAAVQTCGESNDAYVLETAKKFYEWLKEGTK